MAAATAIDIATGEPVDSTTGDDVASGEVYAVGSMTNSDSVNGGSVTSGSGPFTNVITSSSASASLSVGGGTGGSSSNVVPLSMEEEMVVWPPNPSSLQALKGLYAGTYTTHTTIYS